MASHKPTHLLPLTKEEEDKLKTQRNIATGLPLSRVWWGGVRWERMKKYGGGSKHKGRDSNGRMIPDRGGA